MSADTCHHLFAEQDVYRHHDDQVYPPQPVMAMHPSRAMDVPVARQNADPEIEVFVVKSQNQFGLGFVDDWKYRDCIAVSPRALQPEWPHNGVTKP